jgi:hypothetical protein
MIVIVVCHPDDEAIWIGGFLGFVGLSDKFNVSVICLSGRDPNSLREIEFHQARNACGYQSGIVLGGPLRPASTPLSCVVDTFHEGLNKLNIKCSDIDLLITHSPYGDEHTNPHHKQAFAKLYEFTKKNRISFGFFSTIALPIGNLRSILCNFKRLDKYHLIGLYRVSYSIIDRLRFYIDYKITNLPCFLFQLQIDYNKKRKMIDSYPSINLMEHEQYYATITSSVETIYLFDYKGMSVINSMIDTMDVPAQSKLFKDLNLLARFYKKIMKRF